MYDTLCTNETDTPLDAVLAEVRRNQWHTDKEA